MSEERLNLWVQVCLTRDVVLIIWGEGKGYLKFFVPLENFSFGDVTIAGEGPQILTFYGHPRGPVTIIFNAYPFALELSLPVYTT